MAETEPTTASERPRAPRFNAHQEIAERIADRLIKYRYHHDWLAWRRFCVGEIKSALDAARRVRP